jgi:outer membrane receptor protein involved in Fe transport
MSRWIAGSVVAAAMCSVAQAQARRFDIAAGDLKPALEAYAAQSGAQLIYKAEDVKGRATNGVHSEMAPQDALSVLLEGTSLSVRTDATGAMVLFVEPAAGNAQRRVEDGSAPVQQVMVSATRRNEPVQQIPMQVNVMAADELARAGANGLRDYMTMQPGVDVNSFGGATSNDISIRGVSTGNQTVATVGVYVDDAATGSSSAYAGGSRSALNMALMDLNHIEVLRGPQGTLYGAGAMGGVLKYVTNQPETDEFNGSVALTASTTKDGGANYTESGVVNVPLKQDVAALRVSAFKDHEGGSVDTIGAFARNNVDRGDSDGARASLLLTPARGLTVRLTALTQKITRDGNDYVDYDPATSRPLAGDRERSLSLAEPSSTRTNLYSADIEVDFGWGRLNSITTSQRVTVAGLTDYSSVYVPLLAAAGLNFESIGLVNHVVQRKTTQEFRLTSKSDKHFEWLAGLYWDHEQGSAGQQTQSVPATGTPDLNLATLSLPSDYKEVAAYGDATWKLENGLSLTAGARVAQNRQHFQQTGTGVLGASTPLGSSKDISRLWLLTAGYALDANDTVYVRAATGYRPGGPNGAPVAVGGGSSAPATFKADTLTSYEAGYKGNVLDKMLQVEASVYRLDWRDIQQYQVINGSGVIANGGKAAVNGAELALTWRPAQAWTWTASLAYIDAKLTQDAVGLGATSGERLPGSAPISGALSTTYHFGIGGYASYVGATEHFTGERNSGFDGSASNPNYHLPSYALTDLQAGIDFKRASLNLFVRNLFDAHAQQGINALTVPYGGPAWVSLSPARTIGATVNVPF